VFLLKNPTRLVIDIGNARLSSTFTLPTTKNPLFTRIRSAARKQNDLRVVLDLSAFATPKSFTLKPNKTYGHRLVVDLVKQSTSPIISAKRNAHYTVSGIPRDIVIAIDAGHGGEDPGAHGPKGTLEKKVVLAIARKLEKLVNNYPGMKAVMVRKGDYYVGLRKRMQIARKAKADLFVSIHADAFKKSRVKGASVFTLSRKGASSEAARWLAKHENAADLVGGVSLDDKEDVLASVLLDLSQTAAKEASRDVAAKVLRNFGKIGHLHSQKVQNAGFAVLKSPDIPSILVETAFISNPSEERKLRSSKHQKRMANAIFKGILDFFQRNAPPDTRMAAAKHIITRGETLSGIAHRYGVSMKRLKSVNAIANNSIRIGQVLAIPKG
jgi:N-acetylmuramoyl-L-alanine amidase